MDKKAYRKAFKEAVSQIDEDQVKQIKDLVKQSLEKLVAAEKERQTVVKKIQLIKKDLDDLREGRLEQIKERHEADKEADKVSPISPQVLEKIIIGTTPTLNNWQYTGTTSPAFAYKTTVPIGPIASSSSIALPQTYSGASLNTSVVPIEASSFSTAAIGNAVATACVGTYVLADGTVKYF